MRYILASIFFLTAFICVSQNIQDLEEQLSQAKSGKEKMSIHFQLGEAYMRTDAKKAIEHAKAAHEQALQTKNNNVAAEAAFLTSRGYDRRGDDRNQDIWLRSATRFAMQANDADLIIKSVDKRSRLAQKKRDNRKALQIVQEAFDYFSKKGGKGLGQMQAEYELQKAQLEREKQRLQNEKKKLQSDISGLTQERDILKKDKKQLSEKTVKLEEEKAMVEEEITKKEEEILTMSAKATRAMLISERRRHLIDSLEVRQELDSISLVQKEMALENAELQQERGKYLTYILGVASIFTLLLAGMIYLRFLGKKRTTAQLAKQNKIIEAERERSDELLFNIMPAEVAKELKEKGKATAREYPEATVMFIDFKNFTSISERLSPEQLVNALNDLFRSFDHILSQYPEIEKIKTIGDAYLCASGLTQRKSLPKGIVQAALEIQEYLEDHKVERSRQGLPFFEARIGIHTGPVVAGVVGFKKYAYDIWGDTVNIASRMESQCEGGKVNISESTFGKVKYNFDFQPRGAFHVKNKGMMNMYYVIGVRA